MRKYIKDKYIINATEKGYKTIYKKAGYKPYIEQHKVEDLGKLGIDKNRIEAFKELATAGHRDFINYTVAELKEMAKAKGIEGYFTLKKAELVEALEGD